jgi:hypothetical protein
LFVDAFICLVVNDEGYLLIYNEISILLDINLIKLKRMKKITFIIICLIMVSKMHSQCMNTSQWPTSAVTAVNDGGIYNTTACAYYGDYSVLTGLVQNDEYEFSSPDGGYITIRNNSDDSLIGHGASPFTIAVTALDVQIHLNLDASCATDSDCHTISYQNKTVPPPPAPNCAEEPISPTDGAIGITVGTPITVTWTAPSSGPAPTSYDFYVGVESDGSDLALLTNVTTPTVDITFNYYSTTYYWQVVPKNGVTEATGCTLSLWSFTTEAFAGSTPTTLQTITINSCGDSQVATNAYDAASSGIHWIEFIYSGGCEDVVIHTEATTGVSDTELGLFDSNGNFIFTNDDVNTSNYLSSMTVTGLEAGTYYIAAGAWNVTYSSGFNASSSSTTAVGSMVINFTSGTSLSLDKNEFENFSYFPNPVTNKLTLKAQQNIQNVSVFNMLGQEVMRTEMNLQSGELDMSSLQSGAYFVKVSINDTIETLRIIKK